MTISCRIFAAEGIPRVYHSFFWPPRRIILHLMQQPKDARHRKPRDLPGRITKRTFQISVSVKKEEYERITAAAAQGGIGKAAYIRAMTFQGKLIARLTEEEKALFRGMIGVSQGLSQWITVAREQGMTEVLPALESYRASVDKLLNKIRL